MTDGELIKRLRYEVLFKLAFDRIEELEAKLAELVDGVEVDLDAVLSPEDE